MKATHAIAITAVAASLATAAVLMSLGTSSRQATDSALEQRIEALEARPEPAYPVALRPLRHANAAPPPAGDERVHDEAEVQAQADAVMRSLEARFRSETVSPTWAHNTQLAVLEALVSDEAVAAGVQMPDSVEVLCRTSMCRISAGYADDAAAADAATILAMDISGNLPSTHRRTIYKSDGNIELQIYAMKP